MSLGPCYDLESYRVVRQQQQRQLEQAIELAERRRTRKPLMWRHQLIRFFSLFTPRAHRRAA